MPSDRRVTIDTTGSDPASRMLRGRKSIIQQHRPASHAGSPEGRLNVKKTLMICIVAAGMVACGQKNEVAQNGVAAAAAVPGQNPPAVAQQQPAAAAQSPVNVAPASSQLVGTVAEVKDAAGYTYLKIQTASGEQWAAVPQASVKKGANVSVAAQMTMEKFESKTLNKTFDTIVFGTLAGASGSAPVAPAAMLASAKMPPGHPATGANANASGSPQQHMSAPDAGPVNVAKAEGANAKTVAEVWAGRDGLKDKTVVVRGKVVKSLSGIMGMNWIHIHDGSGSQEKGDNDLTVTSVTDGAAVGDVVTITGTIRVDKDFGAGYRYAVIVEDAKIAK